MRSLIVLAMFLAISVSTTAKAGSASGAGPLAPIVQNQIVSTAPTTDTTVTTSTANMQCLRNATATSSGSAGAPNEICGFFSLNIPRGHGSGISYEAMPLYTRCVTADSNTAGLDAYDCVGAEFQAIATGTGQRERIWGADATTRVTEGSDGLVTGFENDIMNGGTAQSFLNTSTVKHNFFGVCGGRACTNLLDFNVRDGGSYYHGIPLVKQYFSSPASDAFSVVDASQSLPYPNIGAIYADGHALFSGKIIATGAAGTERSIVFTSGTSDRAPSMRWAMGTNSATESGSNAGSDFQICNFTDAGAYMGCPVAISRAGGTVVLRSTLIAATVKFAGMTFSALPMCRAESAGTEAYVIDASAAIKTWHQQVTAGGGSNKAFVACNGTGWYAFDY